MTLNLRLAIFALFGEGNETQSHVIMKQGESCQHPSMESQYQQFFAFIQKWAQNESTSGIPKQKLTQLRQHIRAYTNHHEDQSSPGENES